MIKKYQFHAILTGNQSSNAKAIVNKEIKRNFILIIRTVIKNYLVPQKAIFNFKHSKK
jgi:hypothetical protein